LSDDFTFSHESLASTERKLQMLRSFYYRKVKGMLESEQVDNQFICALAAFGAAGWYWYILECLRNEDECYLEDSDFTYSSLAEVMKCKPGEVKEFIGHCIEVCHLLELNGNGHFYSERLWHDMETRADIMQTRSNAGRTAATHRWGKSHQLPLIKVPNDTSKKKRPVPLPEWIDKQTWQDFLEMRKTKRHPATARAVELLIKKLEELQSQGSDPNEVLNQSIMYGWTGLFALKEGGRNGSTKGNPRGIPERDSYTRPGAH